MAEQRYEGGRRGGEAEEERKRWEEKMGRREEAMGGEV